VASAAPMRWKISSVPQRPVGFSRSAAAPRSRDGQGPGVPVAGLAGGRSPGREFAKLVQRLGLAKPVAQVAEQLQGLLVARGGGVVAGQLLQHAEVVEDPGLVVRVARAAEALQGPAVVGANRRDPIISISSMSASLAASPPAGGEALAAGLRAGYAAPTDIGRHCRTRSAIRASEG
jgi:hypothetical protein